MRNKQVKIGFLFDCDGVLIDSEGAYSEIWSRINEEYPTGVENFAQKIKGTTLSKILNENFPDDITRQKVTDRLNELEQQMKYEMTPGAAYILESLQKEDIPAVLVTSSNKLKLQHLREELPDFLDFFSSVIDGDMVEKSKPDPEGYLKGAQHASCLPRNCVVFEDSLQGVMAGKNSGSYVIGVAGTLPANDLQPYSDMVVNSLEDIDLLRLIEILENR